MHAKKRGVESFEKLSREGKIKRKVWVWKRKKERKNIEKWREKYENERMKEKEEKKKRGVARRI
jgi:hypothetical protein